jgi:hypothetical protein
VADKQIKATLETGMEAFASNPIKGLLMPAERRAGWWWGGVCRGESTVHIHVALFSPTKGLE